MGQLYTFHLVGGDPFAIKPEHNPTVSHDGGTSVFTLFLESVHAKALTKQIQSFGCNVVCRLQEGQTKAQHAERLALLGRGKAETTWPSIKCPKCFWFDPREENPCGFESWEGSFVSESWDAHERARKDRAACPVRDIKKSP